MQLSIKMVVMLELNSDEMQLVSQALRGMLNDADMMLAKELQTRIMKDKISRGKIMLEQLFQLESNVNKKG